MTLLFAIAAVLAIAVAEKMDVVVCRSDVGQPGENPWPQLWLAAKEKLRRFVISVARQQGECGGQRQRGWYVSH